MQVLVTIVLPIYNADKYLERCINSVVAQTYENLEIILVDDGSTDNSPSICDNWAEKDARIKVIHKPNAGPGMARNTGIDNATGEFILFFDSDDSVDPTLVEKCVASAQKYSSDVVVYNRSNVYDDGRVVSKIVTAPSDVFDNEGIINQFLPSLFTYGMGFGVSVWSKMFRLDVLNRFGIRFCPEHEFFSEDSFFSLELFPKLTSVSIVRESLYNYYKHSDSLSRSYNSDRQQRNDNFLIKSLEHVREKGYPELLSDSIMVRYHTLTLGSMLQIVRSDLPKKKKKQVIKSIFTNPVLRQTLGKGVLALTVPKSRVFWRLLKFRCYNLCYLLLLHKAHE